jgi:hypothetical protein
MRYALDNMTFDVSKRCQLIDARLSKIIQDEEVKKQQEAARKLPQQENAEFSTILSEYVV